MAQHARLTIYFGIRIYFCDPQSSMATRHQREYQWASAPVLSEGHRSQRTVVLKRSLLQQLLSIRDHARHLTGERQPKRLIS